MKAIRIKGPMDICIDEVPQAACKGDEILVKVLSMGVCESDIGAYRGINPLISYPRVIGQEIAGEVVSLPEFDPSLSVGDRVLLEPYVSCGMCYPCSIGHANCCENLTVRGVHIDGGMVEYVAHPRHLIHKVPDNISWRLVPMAEPLAVAMHAVKQADVMCSEHVIISGAGYIGLLAAQYVLSLGAIPILIDPIDSRLALARKLDIPYAINQNARDVISEVWAITGGRMAEVVVETSGDARAIRNAFDQVSFAGRISFVGCPESDISLPTALITKKELAIKGARNGVGLFEESLKLISDGKINVAALLTKSVSFVDLPSTIRDISEKPDKYLKVTAAFDF